MVDLDPRSVGGVRELLVYVAAVLVAWLAAVLLRAVVRSGGARAARDGEPGPEDVAYLTGGPVQAVYAAVAALRSTGSVQAAGGLLHAGGPPSRGGGELAAAVHHAVRGGVPVTALPAHPAVRAELDRAGARLRGQGALLPAGRRWAMGLSTLPLFVLAVYGVARFAFNLPGADTPEPVPTMLTLIVAVLALVTGIVVVARVQIRTRGANRLVRDLRRRYAALAPRHSPSLTGNGPAAATLAVGLFGTAVLWAADPAFARAANLAEQRVTSGGGYRGDSGRHDSDDSSCSGGGSCGTS